MLTYSEKLIDRKKSILKQIKIIENRFLFSFIRISSVCLNKENLCFNKLLIIFNFFSFDFIEIMTCRLQNLL